MLLFCLQGTVHDKATLMPLQGAKVNVVGTDGSSFSALTDENGAFKFEGSDSGRYINGNVTYAILAEKDGYLVVKDQISTHGLFESTTFVKEYFLPTSRIICRLLPDVYFSQNSFKLTSASIDTLEILVNVLIENPQLVIEVMGYCDSSEHKEIAKRRSQTVRDHLIKSGIHPDRLIATAESESSHFASEQQKLKEHDAAQRELLRARNRSVWYKVIRSDWKE